jgi:hypothetical protein
MKKRLNEFTRSGNGKQSEEHRAKMSHSKKGRKTLKEKKDKRLEKGPAWLSTVMQGRTGMNDPISQNWKRRAKDAIASQVRKKAKELND